MIWTGVLLYISIALYLGWRASRKTESGASFWTADRNLGAGSVGLSISAGFMSVSWSCVYAVQLFYWYGLGALWLITIPWLVALGGIYWLSARYRSLPAFSQPEMVGQRFGPEARKTVALAIAFVFLVWGGAEIYVAATLLSPGLGLTVPATILGISVVVGVYATMGGFRAVVATDKLQYGIVALYVIAMGWLAVKGLSGQDGGFFPQSTVTAAKSGRSWMDLAAPGVATIVITLIAYLPGWLFETDLWLRVQAARDHRAAGRGTLIAAGNAFLFVGLLPMFIGISALVLFPQDGGVTPMVLGNEGDAIFAALVAAYAPQWLVLLVAVGLVAAAMSTIDTCANVMGLSIAYDLFSVHTKEHSTRASRLITVLAMAASCVFALSIESLWDIFYLSGGILTTAVAFPVAAVFLPRISKRGVLRSSQFGLAGTVLSYWLEARGMLAAIEPEWLIETGLGFILWGLLAAGIGYVVGAFRKGHDDFVT